MYTITTGLSALLLAAALHAAPAAAQSPGSAPVGCTGDYVCSEPGVVATWPLERWATVRRQPQQTTGLGKQVSRLARTAN